MELSNKNLFVVPNNIVGQWRDIFKAMYPTAKLLVIEPKLFTSAKREKMLEKMRDEDFDGIIMAYSCFDMLSLSEKYTFKKMASVTGEDITENIVEEIYNKLIRLK